jgi:hypothetical protein
MKKRILLAIAALMVFGLTIVAFAYTNTSTTKKAAMDCCCKGDSCPMKSKDATGKEAASGCESQDCCCKGDSCPMKSKDAAGKESASCCSKDGADSCPMKVKDDGKSADKTKLSCCDKEETAAPKKDGDAAKAADMKNVVVASSTEGCCCSCCDAKKDS